MVSFVYSIILALLILIPLARKWELNLKIVSISTVVIGLFVGLVISIADQFFYVTLPIKLISSFVLIVLTSVSALLVRFYRDPERVTPKGQNIILSPADGLIKYIKHIEKGEIPISSKGREKVKLSLPLTDIFKEGKGYLIGIGMTFLDVHVTRAPTGGKITYFEHIPGSFFSLKGEDAPYRNERVVEIIENDKCKVGFIQIASRMVRRIVAFVKQGDELALGQRVGMIKFGSQVDVVLPELDGLKIKVTIGQQVYAGLSIIAQF